MRTSQTTPKTAAVVVIGNEILSGRTQDKNIAFIGRYLEGLGIILAEVSVLPDIEQRIAERVSAYARAHDYVFTTGGIGPTHDDITTAAIARAFAVGVARRPEAVARMAGYYEAGALTEARLKMADVPEGAILIDNPVSAAPGYQIHNVFVLAGVPVIMQAMLHGLGDRLCGGPPILTASVSTSLTESRLAAGMGKIQQATGAISIGSYPYFKHGRPGVNIVLRGADRALLKRQYAAILKLIEACGGGIVEQHCPV